MKDVRCYAIVLVIFLFSACAQTGINTTDNGMQPNEIELEQNGDPLKNEDIPDIALKDPAQGISIPHPVEYIRKGQVEFTTFQTVMSDKLWSEALFIPGVFPVVGWDGENLFEGLHFLERLDENYNFLNWAYLPYAVSEMKDAKFLAFNRDAGFAYTLAGEQIPFDPSRWEDKEYRDELFKQHGMQLEDLKVTEYHVDADNWKNSEFTQKLTKLFPVKYQMKDESIRIGYLPEKEFQHFATETPGFTAGQRFSRDLVIPLLSTVPVAGSILHSTLSVFTDKYWYGHFGRAMAKNYYHGSNYQMICDLFRRLLKGKDRVIYEQAMAIRELEAKLALQ